MKRPRVFVSRTIPAAGLDIVKAACDAQVWPDRLPPPYSLLRENLRGMDGLLCLLTDRIDDALMDAAGSQLRVISQMRWATTTSIWTPPASGIFPWVTRPVC